MNVRAQKQIVPNKGAGHGGLPRGAAIEKFLSAGWDVVSVSRRKPELPSGWDIEFVPISGRGMVSRAI